MNGVFTPDMGVIQETNENRSGKKIKKGKIWDESMRESHIDVMKNCACKNYNNNNNIREELLAVVCVSSIENHGVSTSKTESSPKSVPSVLLVWIRTDYGRVYGIRLQRN